MGKWYIQISVEIPTEQTNSDATMGIDLGLKVPAVVVTSSGKTKFLGNSRQNKYIRRKYKARRRKMGKLKKLSVIRKQQNKEHRYMKDQNHKISRQIVNMAIDEQVSVITLAGIRVVEVNPAYTSQTCPICGKRNKAIDRTYRCSCGFHAHRDRVGAINIMDQPVADGNSLSA